MPAPIVILWVRHEWDVEAHQKQPKYNVNASLYDIKEGFQGRSDKGKMSMGF
jgi:hypothetical protein